jgi:hypothetical protein
MADTKTGTVEVVARAQPGRRRQLDGEPRHDEVMMRAQLVGIVKKIARKAGFEIGVPPVWWTLSEATGSVIRTGGVIHGRTQAT